MPTPRAVAGALIREALNFEWNLLHRWERIHNRHERITVGPDGRGVRCEWPWTSTLRYCDVFPVASARLMGRALEAWPIRFADEPPLSDSPAVTFIIGHRGADRVSGLQLTIATIAAQTRAAIECIVVEQSTKESVRSALPSWVRFVHLQTSGENEPYRRAWSFNEGVRHARGAVLVLHDNDMLAPIAYASEIVRHLDAGLDAVDLKRFIFYMAQETTRRLNDSRAIDAAVASTMVLQNARGGSVAITRSAYEAIGGFDESFVGWGGEDLEFWERAETQRASVFGYLPFLHLWHPSQPEKEQGRQAPAVLRYLDLQSQAAEARIEAILQRKR